MARTATAERVPAATLRALCIAILAAAGVPNDEAEIVAESLVAAELRGQASHGVVRLDTYVRRLHAGLIRPGAELVVIADAPALTVYDARDGFGHVVGIRVMDACIARARETGIAAAAVRNGTHFGIAGIFALRAAAAQMIGLATSNAAARMPPHGAKTPVLGTNPLAIAVPSPDGGSILLDMATSATALGRILMAQERGEEIPEGWALTKDGRPTRDPAEAISGSLLPMAGPKGFGLALMLEVLSACLSGASVGRSAGSMYSTWDRPEGLGHFFLAISPDAVGRASDFLQRVAELARQVHGAEPLEGAAAPLLPGEPEALREVDSRREGVALTPSVRDALRRLAAASEIPCAI